MDKRTLLVKEVDLYDVINGKKIPSMNVFVKEGIFDRITETEITDIPDGVDIIDGSGLTMIPGLIDAHVHIAMSPEESVAVMMRKSPAAIAFDAVNHLKSLIENGITCVRSMGDPYGIDIAAAKAIEKGKIIGPEIVPSGMLICMTGGHGWQFGFEADGCDEVRRAVRNNIKSGAKNIKLVATGGVLTPNVKSESIQLSYEELLAGVEEAKHAGLSTASHAQGRMGIYNAVRAGVSSIEHGFELDDEITSMMLEKGTYYVPTIAALRGILENGDKVDPWVIEKTIRANDNHRRSVQLAIKKGVKIALGTDAGTPSNAFGASARNEYVDLIRYGMEPIEALRAGTINAARLLGREKDRGSIEPGKIADFLLFDTDPVEVPDAMTGAMMVYKAGSFVSA